MKNRIVTHYYIKESKADDKHLAPIYLRITINGTRAEISANRRVATSEWNKVTERVSGRSEQSRTINAALISLQNKVDKCFLKLEGNGSWLKAKDLIDELRGRKADNVTLLEAFKHYLSEMKKLIGTDYAPRTVIRYEVVLHSLEEYLERIFFEKDIKLIDLDARFLESYNTFLKGSKGLHHNTVVKNIKIIKRVIHISMINRWLAEDPFREISVAFKETYRGYLSTEEIEAIYTKELSVNRLARLRDCFIFQIYTGLAHADLLVYGEVKFLPFNNHLKIEKSWN